MQDLLEQEMARLEEETYKRHEGGVPTGQDSNGRKPAEPPGQPTPVQSKSPCEGDKATVDHSQLGTSRQEHPATNRLQRPTVNSAADSLTVSTGTQHAEAKCGVSESEERERSSDLRVLNQSAPSLSMMLNDSTSSNTSFLSPPPKVPPGGRFKPQSRTQLDEGQMCISVKPDGECSGRPAKPDGESSKRPAKPDGERSKRPASVDREHSPGPSMCSTPISKTIQSRLQKYSGQPKLDQVQEENKHDDIHENVKAIEEDKAMGPPKDLVNLADDSFDVSPSGGKEFSQFLAQFKRTKSNIKVAPSCGAQSVTQEQGQCTQQTERKHKQKGGKSKSSKNKSKKLPENNSKPQKFSETTNSCPLSSPDNVPDAQTPPSVSKVKATPPSGANVKMTPPSGGEVSQNTLSKLSNFAFVESPRTITEKSPRDTPHPSVTADTPQPISPTHLTDYEPNQNNQKHTAEKCSTDKLSNSYGGLRKTAGSMGSQLHSGRLSNTDGSLRETAGLMVRGDQVSTHTDRLKRACALVAGRTSPQIGSSQILQTLANNSPVGATVSSKLSTPLLGGGNKQFTPTVGTRLGLAVKRGNDNSPYGGSIFSTDGDDDLSDLDLDIDWNKSKKQKT